MFIDQLNTGDRILLLYEEPEYARMLNFHYIRRGLDNGEKCIYLVVKEENDHAKDNNSVHYSRVKTRKKNNDEDKKEKKAEEDDESVEFIKRDMDDTQIDVSHFISKSLLYIGTSPREPRVKSNNSELFVSMLPSTFYNVRKSASSSSSSSPSIQYRLVLDVKPELDPMKYKLAYLLELEEFYHSMFHSLLGSSICSYPVRNIEQTLSDYSEYGKLTTLRLNSHTGVIFARKFGKGLALALQ